MLEQLLRARSPSNGRGGEKSGYRAPGPHRAMHWGLAFVLVAAMLSFPLPAQALFAPSPIHKALFHFLEASGTSTLDTVSGTNACLGATASSPCPAASTSSPAWTSDARYGSALLFDGIDDMVTFSPTAGLDWSATNNDVVDIEAWIKPTKAGTILSKGGSASHNYRLAIDGAGDLVFSYTDTKGRFRQLTSPFGGDQGAPVSFNQWHWISVDFSQNYDVIEMIVDGGMNDRRTRAFNTPSAPAPMINTAALSIGSFGGRQDFFGGVIDELRISITPNSSVYGGGYPEVGSDRGVVLSGVEFAPTSGPQFFELYRPNFGDGAPPISLSGASIVNASNNEYDVPSTGAGCFTGNTNCYLISPGQTVRIYLNGAGPATDTASVWYTSNCSPFVGGACTLGRGGPGQNLGTADLLHLRSTGFPKDPDNPRYLLNADVVVWGADQSANSYFSGLISPEGLWPGTVTWAGRGYVATSSPFVSVTATTTGIVLITPGNNLAGPAAWGTQ